MTHRNKEIAVYYLMVACIVDGVIKYDLKVGGDKLKVCIVNPRAQVGELQPIDQIWFTAFPHHTDKVFCCLL